MAEKDPPVGVLTIFKQGLRNRLKITCYFQTVPQGPGDSRDVSVKSPVHKKTAMLSCFSIAAKNYPSHGRRQSAGALIGSSG